VKTLATVVGVVLLTTVIGLLCWVVWARTMAPILPRIVPDSFSDSAYFLIVGIAFAPPSIPAALAFRWLWRRLVHQALTLKTTAVIYLHCAVGIPSLFYFCFVVPIITYEEAIVFFLATFLLMAFVIFRINRGRQTGHKI
jgi:hypothetical protein